MELLRSPGFAMALWFAGCFVGWITGSYLVQRLQAEHPNLYRALGSPQLFGPPFKRSTWQFLALAALGIRCPQGDRQLRRAVSVFRLWLLFMPLILWPFGWLVVAFFYGAVTLQLVVALIVSATTETTESRTHAAQYGSK